MVDGFIFLPPQGRHAPPFGNGALGRGIQYSRERKINRWAAAYWIIRFRG
jgi:hypothetical protein